VIQRALQSGKPMPVTALMTAGNNIVSIIGGLLVFGDPLGHRPAMVLAHVTAFMLIVVAAWLSAPTRAPAIVPGRAPRSHQCRVHTSAGATDRPPYSPRI
jgi:hypothetical protein